MPPEQFGGHSTPSSDLYALGATLIYLATGQHPDRLPQREMRLLFEDAVNLNPHLIDWLKWLTEPSTDLRLKSAQEALEALESSNWRQSSTAISPQPSNTHIKIINTREIFEILILPRGFPLGRLLELLLAIGFAIAWNSFWAFWRSNDWFMNLFAIGLFIAAIKAIWDFIFALWGKVRLQITRSKILMTYEILDLRVWAIAALRQNVVRIELHPLSYKKDSEGNNVAFPPKINILAGNQTFSLQEEHHLNSWELEWLAEELSNWLKLPIVRL